MAGELPARVRASSEHALAFDDPGLAAGLIGLAAEVAAATGIAGPSYRLIANTGPGGGQTVFHAHRGWPGQARALLRWGRVRAWR
ncbi:hypothetical protein [Crossiella sp. CA198]|uniref:hypothetical protein n=1 Tax=Crossiella sp. CA198 TaxID=3455607 RepID=UPI003F8D13CC